MNIHRYVSIDDCHDFRVCYGVPLGSKVYYQCDMLIILRGTLIILRATLNNLCATLNYLRGT